MIYKMTKQRPTLGEDIFISKEEAKQRLAKMEEEELDEAEEDEEVEEEVGPDDQTPEASGSN